MTNSTRSKVMRVNLGCGLSPTPGWINIDNSPSVRLSHHLILTRILELLGLFKSENRKMIQLAHEMGIIHGSGLKLSMLADASVDAVYSSHMMQQLYREDVPIFLSEIRRVLVPGGIIRLAMADLRREVEEYLQHEDADQLVLRSFLWPRKPKTFWDRIQIFLLGLRSTSCWAYDGKSLCKLLEANGFCDARVLPPNETMIPNPGPLNLAEGVAESVFVEARKSR